jgi:hypothetical protein
MAPKAKKTAERVWVRVAVNMARVHRGQRLLVDPEDEDIKVMLQNDALVREEPPPK